MRKKNHSYIYIDIIFWLRQRELLSMIIARTKTKSFTTDDPQTPRNPVPRVQRFPQIQTVPRLILFSPLIDVISVLKPAPGLNIAIYFERCFR